MMKSNKFEFSKLVVILSFIMFIACIVRGDMLAREGVDTTFIITAISISGGAFASTVAFYLNKTKMYNTARLKCELIKWEYEFKSSAGIITESDVNDMSDDLDNMEESIDSSIDSEFTESLDEDVTIDSY